MAFVRKQLAHVGVWRQANQAPEGSSPTQAPTEAIRTKLENPRAQVRA